ncbi:MAG: hypothetical protein ACI8P0_002642 [Planctomycetaceae bacterium]|jgi:hypothetical protein
MCRKLLRKSLLRKARSQPDGCRVGHSPTKHGSGFLRMLSAAALTFFLIAGFVDSPVAAQGEPTTNGAVPSPAPPPAAEPAAADVTSDWERLIYLPYKNLKDVFGKHGSTVFMPYAEYVKRWQQGNQPPQKNIVEAVVTESHYTATVDRSLLRIKASLTVQVLGKPWVEVPIQFGNAAVGKLTVEDGKQVLLKGTGNGTYALLFGQAGEHSVEIELAASIQTSPDGRQVDFNIPAVGVTTFELAIPEADQTVDVQPHLIALPVEAAATETRIKANLGATTKISASWHPRTSQKPDMDLLAAVTNYQKVTLRDGLVHTDAFLNYDILRGEMTELAIAVPVGHRILGVSSSDAKIRGWRAEPGEQRQTVRVEFLSPATDKVSIEVHTEREFSADAIQLAGRDADGNFNGIHAIDAVRESGQLAVAGAKDLSLQFEQVTGLVRIEDAEVHALLRQAGAATFKFYSSNIQLQVLAKPVEARLVLKSSYRFEFADDELKLVADLGYQVERAGVFEFQIALPDELEVDRVESSTGHNVREFHVEGEGPRTLRVVMQQKTGVDVQVGLRLTAHQSFEEASESLELSLPIPEPQGAERETAEVYVSASEALEVITDQESLEAAQPLPVPPGQSRAGKRVAAAWSFNRRPVTIPLRTNRRPTRLSAQVATTIDVKEEVIQVSTELRYLVQYAGLDVFRFAVPEEVSELLQVTSLGGASAPAIKQKVPAEEAVDGWVTWTVTMQRDVLGQHRFQLTWDVKPPNGFEDSKLDGEPAAADQTGSSEIVFQTARVLGLDGSDEKQRVVELSNVSGEIAVRKDRSLSVSAKTLDESLEAIDVRELSLLPQTGSLAYRYFKQPVGFRIESTKHEIQKVVETVVTRALVEVVMRRDTQANYRCRYRIRSSERQRLRVDVPGGSELLGVFIDGQQVSPEKNSQPMETEGWDSYFVNVARPGSSDDLFSLTLQMMTPIGDTDVPVPFETSSEKQTLRLPQIGGLEAAGVVLQQLQTVIWTPEGFNLLGDASANVDKHDAAFTHETKLRVVTALAIRRQGNYDNFNVDDWVGVPAAGFIDFPTEGNRFRFSSLGSHELIVVTWASQSSFTWLASGALLLIAILLRGLSWDTKLLLILIAAFAAILFGLSSPGWSAEVISAARFGIYALFGIWVLHTVFSWKSGAAAQPETPDEGPPPGPIVGASLPVVIPPPGVFDDLRKQFGN